MAFTPFDFNEAVSQRRDHANEGLRFGSPVVGVSCTEGLAIVTVRRSQRKVFEIYDRIIYSAIGNQSDIEAIRLGAVDLAAREGFQRSPDDVTAQRLVGFSLSPALKEIFRDQWRAPSIIRALFGELGDVAEQDRFYILNYDGEFATHTDRAALAGSAAAEDRMLETLHASMGDSLPDLSHAIEAALRAWATGSIVLNERHDDDSDSAAYDDRALRSRLREELRSARVEAGILERAPNREARFRLLESAYLDPIVALLIEDNAAGNGLEQS